MGAFREYREGTLAVMDDGTPANLRKYQSNPEVIREVLWSLAYEEERIGGWKKMSACYGHHEMGEHALFGQEEAFPNSHANFAHELAFGQAYQWVRAHGGRFLPARGLYGHLINAKDFGYLDLRWFVHGYLSDPGVLKSPSWWYLLPPYGMINRNSIGVKTSYAKVYDGLQYGLGSHVSKIHNYSLWLGFQWRHNQKTLADFARRVAGEPPAGSAYKQSVDKMPNYQGPLYKLTRASLLALARAGVPQVVRRQLMTMVNTNVTYTLPQFMDNLRTLLTAEEVQKYRESIKKAALQGNVTDYQPRPDTPLPYPGPAPPGG